MTSAKPIRVLVVDDSALMRKLMVKMLAEAEDIEVVATAMDGQFALDKVTSFKPDVITLDLEMPRMDGLTTLRRIVTEHRLPVVLVSSYTSEGATATFDGLAAGAVDFVTKPSRILSSFDSLSSEVLQKIRVAARARVRNPLPEKNEAETSSSPKSLRAAAASAGLSSASAEFIVAIAVSTGGPNALTSLLSDISYDFGAGLVIVQHMPEGFTAQFAERLARVAAIDVKEATDGDLVTSGRALIAPGGAHLLVRRAGSRLLAELSRSAPVRGHRPSADVLFESVARAAGDRALGLILTGMGEDGASGMEAIRGAGGRTVAQDENTSVVYGMPRAAIARGAVQKVLPLPLIGKYLNGLKFEAKSWRT